MSKAREFVQGLNEKEGEMMPHLKTISKNLESAISAFKKSSSSDGVISPAESKMITRVKRQLDTFNRLMAGDD